MAAVHDRSRKRSAGETPRPLAGKEIERNLNGQKMGRKGRITRERILDAAVALLESDDEEPITLSAVARGAGLGMTSLYNYFSDLTEVLLAVLDPVMDTAEEAYMAKLRDYWPDEELGERCLDFVTAYHRFWARHSRLLHLRNAMADQHDERMILHRVESTRPVIALVVGQMVGTPREGRSPAAAMATLVMTGIERSITVATDQHMPKLFGEAFSSNVERFLSPGARLMELAIRDMRGLADKPV
jgi:AcrR family transcriptional regulator